MLMLLLSSCPWEQKQSRHTEEPHYCCCCYYRYPSSSTLELIVCCSILKKNIAIWKPPARYFESFSTEVRSILWKISSQYWMSYRTIFPKRKAVFIEIKSNSSTRGTRYRESNINIFWYIFFVFSRHSNGMTKQNIVASLTCGIGRTNYVQSTGLHVQSMALVWKCDCI